MKTKSYSAMSKQKKKPLFPEALLHSFVIASVVFAFIFICLKIDLTQDDAYISFRYAANFISGHGLVYNIGERVEGYTNFLWIILLACFKMIFNVEFITFAKVAGVICGSTIFLLLYLLLKHHTGKVHLPTYIMIVVVLLCNLSIPYWSIAGLETSAFSCMIIAAIVAEYRWRDYTHYILIVASLLRPEGLIVFAIILLNRIMINRRMPWNYILFYSIPMLLFALFKLLYYGSLFPNPYYAKSGIGWEYIETGLEYTWFFFKTIGVYGTIFFIPLIMVKRLWEKYSLLYLFITIYTLYIIWIGGDVLRAYRFFFPVIPVLAYLFVISLLESIAIINVKQIRKYQIAFILTCIFSYYSYSLSESYIRESRDMENGLKDKMIFISSMLKQNMKWNYSIAASTIGILGYQLMEHRVIDMLGLTEPFIAHNPEIINAISSSWKERRFNSRYLLEQQPDFILFATDFRPSAPAEKALLLHSEFRNKYMMTGFMAGRSLYSIWQKKEPVDISKDVICPDIEFVDKYAEGCPQRQKSDARKALISLNEAQSHINEEYPVITFFKGYRYRELNMKDSAAVYYNRVLAMDSMFWQARYELAIIAGEKKDTKTASEYIKMLRKQCPWIFKMNNYQ